MYCKNCGNALDEDARICPECGESVEEASFQPVQSGTDEGNTLGIIAIIGGGNNPFNRLGMWRYRTR